ncbi:MAG: hypothetical protein HY586_05860 [Candidatus Omnitrophica bacterium]|nr:hypothetical protein [Candidatus Omnitrophota bacterium]
MNAWFCALSAVAIFLLCILLWASRRLFQTRTELEQTRIRLMQSDRLATIGKLASMISHEFRNELGVMRNAAYFIKMKLLDAQEKDEKVIQHVEILEERIRETDRIIENIITFSKTRQPNFAPTGAAELIYSTIGRMKIPPHIKVTTELEPDLPEFMADELQISMALMNIILNAIQAIGERPGWVRITAGRHRGGMLGITVGDDGPGIPEKNLEHLFEPLFTTKARGAGLGLATAQMLIESHGGMIHIESKLGRGTTVGIKLPLARIKQKAA